MVSLRKRGTQPQEGKTSTESKETPVKAKKSGRNKILIAAAPLTAAVIIVIAIYFLQPYMQKTCRENWDCGQWSTCVGGQQSRECTDKSQCGTSKSKPATEQACVAAAAKPQCKAPGSQCSATECCGSCVHGTCRAETTYCGDTFCDAGETCTSCAADCGACASGRELQTNIYTRPLLLANEQDLKARGYVIVRYFYSKDCAFCTSPTDIETQLRDLANHYKDLFVLVLINTAEYPAEATQYGSIGGTVYKPTIRVDGKANNQYGYDMLFGYSFGQKLQDGDVTADVAPLICKHSDYCDFTGDKIVRTSP